MVEIGSDVDTLATCDLVRRKTKTRGISQILILALLKLVGPIECPLRAQKLLSPAWST